jgi:ferredoxin
MIRKTKERKGHESCSGCGVCLLSCPVCTGLQCPYAKGKGEGDTGGYYEEIGLNRLMPVVRACGGAYPEDIGLQTSTIPPPGVKQVEDSLSALVS